MRHYEIPAFQRPYVWNEEDQWAPLWDDITRVAEVYIASKEAGEEADPPRHFLGAVVYESAKAIAGDVTRHSVIDGQQRMTTLQLLMDAVQEVIEARDHEIYAESLEELILNKQKAFAKRPQRFKLWPSQTDRTAFVQAMESNYDENTVDHRVIEAHRFFRAEAHRWIAGEADESGVIPPATEDLRVEALSETLQNLLTLVAIDLSGHDDAQLIFETLNDRGTPLLKSDLIKNWVFRRGESLGADVERWSESVWAEFDGPWWREELAQGRQIRSRIDIFLQYWLTMRTRSEVKTDLMFAAFTHHAAPQMLTPDDAETLLTQLRADADIYRSFAQLTADSTAGRFHARVIESMELATTTPLFLRLLSTNYAVPEAQVRIGLEAIESWVIRRTLLRMTTKDVNKFVVTILRELDDIPPSEVGGRIKAFLAEQTAEARIWPTDTRMLDELPKLRVYGSIKQSRLRVILAAVEQQLRSTSAKHEDIALPAGLQVEHIMPRAWRTHWDTGLTPDQASARDRAVNTMGNLTLVTQALNGSLSNRPWTDAEAAGLKEGGHENTGKRSLLGQFSLLALNKQIVDHADAWTENDIEDRARLVTKAICAAWPGPSAG